MSSRASAFFICITSPLTRCSIDVDMSSTASKLRSRASDTDERASRKSPASTAILPPNTLFTDGRPRRVSASSITSSCIKLAVWIISLQHKVTHFVKKQLHPLINQCKAADARDLRKSLLRRARVLLRLRLRQRRAPRETVGLGRARQQQYHGGAHLLAAVVLEEVARHRGQHGMVRAQDALDAVRDAHHVLLHERERVCQLARVRRQVHQRHVHISATAAMSSSV
ncbi:hypothetical protein PRIC2_005575 [Phytophthora ramorum]